MKQKLRHQWPSTPLESQGKNAVKRGGGGNDLSWISAFQNMCQASALDLASSSEGQKWKRRSPAREQRRLETSLEKVESNLGGGWGVFVSLCVNLEQKSGRNTEVLSRRLAEYRP